MGVLTKIFGQTSYRWVRPTGLTPRGRRKQYKGRQRSNAAAGESVWIRFTDGDVYQVRITGSLTDFIDQVLAKADQSEILAVWTERGSLKGPEARFESN